MIESYLYGMAPIIIESYLYGMAPIIMVISIIISKDTHKSNLLEKGPNSKPATPW